MISSRVAHILTPYIQPTETFIYDRLRNHKKYKPFVLTDEAPVNIREFPFSPIVSLSDMKRPVRKTNTLLMKSLAFSPFYYFSLKKEDADVVHAHYGPVGVSVASAASAADLPLMVSFYGIDASAFLDSDKHKSGYRKLFKTASVISVLSKDMGERLMAAGCPEKLIRIHHLAVNTDVLYRAENPVRANRFSIVSVGRMVPKKGMEHLIKAFSLFLKKHPDSELHLVGSGPLEASLRALSSSLQVSDRVFFHGHKSRDSVIQLIREADIFCLFSVTGPDGDMEGTPTALIEAGALGIPSVSTLHAGIPEVIADGVTGFLVPEKAENVFAERLSDLASDAKLRTSMGFAAREKIVREFDIKNVMSLIEKDYDSMK